ncbi:MAG: hypothetical protein ACP5VR_11360 [Acidimicrobiales bacterium]
MGPNPTRMCELLVGLPAVHVLDVPGACRKALNGSFTRTVQVADPFHRVEHAASRVDECRRRSHQRPRGPHQRPRDEHP